MEAPPAPDSRPLLLLPFPGWASARGPGAGRRPEGGDGGGAAGRVLRPRSASERAHETRGAPALPDGRGAHRPQRREPGSARGRAALASPPRAARTAGPPRAAAEAEDPGRRTPQTLAARGNQQGPGGPRRLGMLTPEAARTVRASFSRFEKKESCN
ncbi:uncharacterized protein [Tursiops truncatus]|uniref:Uncharacterized protein LOC109548754 n=1 Tax=Tursiops truncatus TaxID=9739 RepID=A0A2U4AR35_TURTR|nr:uncharacterized protein LOC109548754 [Tursiops truncatus]